MKIHRLLKITAAIWLVRATPSEATCDFFAEPQRYNTQNSGDVIVIGQQADRRYRVVLSGEDERVLAEIQACIPDAFATSAQFGPYIQIASFSSRADAETIRRILRKEGYRARVIYAR